MRAIFESYLIQQIINASTNLSVAPNLYHWRSNGGAEVDIILERDGWLYPIEIKAKSNLTNQDARSLLAFNEIYPKARIKPGIIIYAGERCYRMNQYIIALPFSALV